MEPKKMFVLMLRIAYEGEQFLGLFETIEQASKAATRSAKKRGMKFDEKDGDFFNEHEIVLAYEVSVGALMEDLHQIMLSEVK